MTSPDKTPGLTGPLARPPLVARQEALDGLLMRARRGERVLVVAGPHGVGTSRLAMEAAREIAAERGVVIRAARGGGTPAERMNRALTEAGLDGAPDGVTTGPVVVLVGDVAPHEEVPAPPARLVSATRVTVLATARAPRDGCGRRRQVPTCARDCLRSARTELSVPRERT